MMLWCAGITAFSLMYAPQGLLPAIARDYDLSAGRAAWLVSAATAGLALSLIPWALVADRVGRGRAMRCAAVAAAVLAVASAAMPNIELMIGCRFLLGVAVGGLPALAMSYAHDRAAAGRAAGLAASYVAATSIGGLGGRVVSVPLAGFVGWRTSLLVVGIAGAVVAIVMACLIETSGHEPVPTRTGLRLLRMHLTNRSVVPLYVIGGLLIGAMVAVYNTLGFRLEREPYDLAPTAVSLVFFAYLAGTVSSRLSARLSKRLTPRGTMLLACVLVVTGAALTAARPLVVVVAGVVVLTAGMFLGHSTANTFVSALADTGRTQANSLYSISYYVGSSIFGALGGTVLSVGGWPAEACYVAALAVIAAILVAFARGRR